MSAPSAAEISRGLTDIRERQVREQLAACEAALSARDEELAALRKELADAVEATTRARETCAAYNKRYREDHDQLLALWGELWRLAAARGDASPGLAGAVMDRGGKEVARLVQASHSNAVLDALTAEAQKLGLYDLPEVK